MATTTTVRPRNGHQKERVTGSRSRTQPTKSPQVERFSNLERKPHDTWLVQTLNEYGEREVFLRVECTGLFPRRFGPFKNDHDALVFLDRVASEVWDAYSEATNHCDTLLHIADHIIKEDAYTLQHLPRLNGHHHSVGGRHDQLAPTKPGSITLAQHEGVLFIVTEPDRNGVLKWWVRMIIGDLDPIRRGPFETEKQGRTAFEEECQKFENNIVDVFPTTNASTES